MVITHAGRWAPSWFANTVRSKPASCNMLWLFNDHQPAWKPHGTASRASFWTLVPRSCERSAAAGGMATGAGWVWKCLQSSVDRCLCTSKLKMHEKTPAVCVLYTSTLADLETQVAASPYFAAMIATCPCDLLSMQLLIDSSTTIDKAFLGSEPLSRLVFVENTNPEEAGKWDWNTFSHNLTVPSCVSFSSSVM